MIKAEEFKKILKIWADIMLENKEKLMELDAVVGDGDLGLTMSDGFLAAYKAVQEDQAQDIGMLSYHAGKAMSTAVPSTMGTLMASGFMAAGKGLKGRSSLDLDGFYQFFQCYFDGVQNRGKAKIGEKTFLDGMIAIVQSLKEDSEKETDFLTACKKLYPEAKKAYEATVGMLAVHGRAATRGEASRSLYDPGAAVAMFMAEGIQRFVEGK